jgi:hypothetical protein
MKRTIPDLDRLRTLQRKALDLISESHKRQAREEVRIAARLVRKGERTAREALKHLPAWGQLRHPEEALPFGQQEYDAFRSALTAASEALRLARASIPPCAPAGKIPLDAVDRAPKPGRLSEAIRKEARKIWPRIAGADLRDLFLSLGLERPPMDNAEDVRLLRKRQEEAKRRAKNRSHRVTTTVRRKK